MDNSGEHARPIVLEGEPGPRLVAAILGRRLGDSCHGNSDCGSARENGRLSRSFAHEDGAGGHEQGSLLMHSHSARSTRARGARTPGKLVV